MFPEYKDNFLFVYITANHKKCPPSQWKGKLLLRPEEYFPGELPGEEDYGGPATGEEKHLQLAQLQQDAENPAGEVQAVLPPVNQPPAGGEAVYLFWLAAARAAAAAQKVHGLSI